MTLNSVGVTDDRLGRYYRRTMAIADRLDKSISYDKVMSVLQLIHDNKIEEAIKTTEDVTMDDSDLPLFGPITIAVDVSEVNTFVVREKIRSGEIVDGVKIAGFGPNFKRKFLSKTEERNAAPTLLCIRRLSKISLDTPIITELGDSAKFTFAHFWELLKKQGHGQEMKRMLVVNGMANIAYIRDEDGTIWNVRAAWDFNYDGWYFEALPPDTQRFGVGCSILSN